MINLDISNPLENIILRLLEKQPYLRPFQSATELAEKLKEIPLLKKDLEFHITEDKTPIRKEYFVRLLHNEKTDLENFLKSGGLIDGVEYTANYLPKYKNQVNVLNKYKVPFYTVKVDTDIINIYPMVE